MNEVTANPPPPAPAETADAGWSRTRWLAVILFIFAAHVALVFLFGQKKAVMPRAVKNVPTLKLAADAAEMLALNDPTLFALPHQRDFGSAGWLKLPDAQQPSFRWTEAPRWLPLSTAGLGAAFGQFMQTNPIANYPLNFKPAPQLSTPALPVESLLPQNSTFRIEGRLARRQLPSSISLTNWPYANVIAPSVVQVLVDPSGNVISAVLLPPGDGYAITDQYDAADQRALEIARTLRFKPAPQLTVGRVLFDWHTVPVPSTNEPDL